jgi:hypothetical protein
MTDPCSGAIAQLGERVLCKHEVVGSIPSGSTSFGRPMTEISFVLAGSPPWLEPALPMRKISFVERDKRFGVWLAGKVGGRTLFSLVHPPSRDI